MMNRMSLSRRLDRLKVRRGLPGGREITVASLPGEMRTPPGGVLIITGVPLRRLPR